jgi:tetratricopeptide (TPR) repeat protein
MLHQVMSLTLLATMSAAVPAVPQGIPRGATITGQSRGAAQATRVFVANPYVAFATLADSSAAVLIGNAMRDRLDGRIGTELAVIQRQEMNTDLMTYGYSPNAILTLGSAISLGKQMSARIFVTSLMAKSSSGGWSLVIRVSGLNEDAGQVIRSTSDAAQPLPDFGAKAANLIIPVIMAHKDAKSCVDLAATKPDKAVEAANRALKVIPNYGLAEYCLATMSLKKDEKGAEAALHLENAVKGDPSSLTAWSQLAIIHQKQNDSAKTVADYQSMLREEPTNTALAKEAVNVFRKYHRPDALKDLVKEQKKLDPTNTDWYDLAANGCLGDNDYACALTEMEQIWVLDSSRADKDYFNKIIFIAKSKPDTQAYLKYAKFGEKKFPTDVDIGGELAQAYTWAGQTDSTVAVTNRLIALDAPGQLANVLMVVKSLVDANQTEKILPFTNYFRKFGDDDAKFKFAGLGFQGQQAMYQAFAKDTTTPHEAYGRVVVVGDSLLAAGTTRTTVVEPINLFMGLAAYQQIFPLQQQLQTQKTCELAKQYDALLAKAEPSLTLVANGSNAQLSGIAKPLLTNVTSAKPYAAAQLKALCTQ